MARIKEAVVDAGPFIHVQEIKRLSLFKLFEKIATTKEILEECKKISALLKKLGNLHEIPLHDKNKDFSKYILERYDLDLGEATGIALCKQENIRLFFTDDLDAREIAHALGFEPHGTIAVILRAFREKIIEKKEAKQAVEELCSFSSLFLTRDLKIWVMKEIDEFK